MQWMDEKSTITPKSKETKARIFFTAVNFAYIMFWNIECGENIQAVNSFER